MKVVWIPDIDSWWNFDRSTWDRQFALWPVRSHDSNQLIWFKYAWRGYRMISGPGDPVIIKKWLTEQEYLMYLLKNNH